MNSIRHGHATALVTTSLMLEYEAVCPLPQHRLAAGLSEKDVECFLDAIAFFAEPVEIHYHWRPVLRDPGDEMVLEAAVNGRAGAIVTFNRRHYEGALRQFGIEVVSPGEALRRIQV